ncbi:hypothetical protein JCM11251_003049 [Rhodosporidiobolus azoricus]
MSPSTHPPSLVVSASPSPSSSSPSPPASPLRSTSTHVHAGDAGSPAATTTTNRRSKSPGPAHHRTASTSSNRSLSSRARSLSPAPATSHSLSALGSPPGHPSTASPLSMSPPTSSPSAASSAPPPAGSTIRPAPVVPPSPTPAASAGYASRPTSPRPSEPASPTRARAASSTAGGGGQGGVLLSPGSPLGMDKGGFAGGERLESSMSRSGSQVDLSHIFERDVEFAPSHLITPSEAVDVAVPPVLTAAAEALSFSTAGDPLVAHEIAALANEAEQDAQAGSGWSSPVLTPGGVGLYHPNVTGSSGGGQAGHAYAPHQASPLHAHHMANSSRSPVRGTTRSFSPDSNPARNRGARSPDSASGAADDQSSTAGFSVGTPPTSNGGGSPPPLSAGSPKVTAAGGAGIVPLGPFGQKLAEALENAASRPGHTGSGLLTPGGTSPEATKPASYTPIKPSLLLPFPTGATDASLDPFSGFSPSSTSASAVSSSPLHSPLHEGSNPFASLASPSSGGVGSSAPSPALAAPHPRRLSFYSYADLINEERIQELKGEGIGPAEVQAPAGLGVGSSSAVAVGSRNVSGGSGSIPLAALEAVRGGKVEEDAKGVEGVQKGVEGLQISA